MSKIIIACEKRIKVEKKIIRSIAKYLIAELKLSVNSLEINFLSSETVLGINKKFLHHDYRTDIITFDYSNERNILDGEILISFADAVKNSKLYRVTIENELLRLIAHGILHLIGYNDTTVLKRKKMKQLENRLVKKYYIKSK